MRVAVVLGLVGAVVASVVLFESASAEYAERADVRAYVDQLAAEYDFDPTELLQMFAQAERKQSILDAIARPAERSKAWHEYRRIFLTPERIEKGAAFWRQNAEILERAQTDFAVDPQVVVAIIGVETLYGENTGSYRVVDALTTLGFDYPPRSKFFRGELTELLLLAREEGISPVELMGSYAGAMGYGQFIPSSFRAYAVDFDGDGTRDIWENTTDAIGSVANYFHRHGWRSGEPVVLRVESTGPLPDGVANAGLKLAHTVGELRGMGLVIDAALADSTPAALFEMQTEQGPEYWLGLHNFYVITRYNRSRLYALAVVQLGDAIAEEFGAETGSVSAEVAVAGR